MNNAPKEIEDERDAALRIVKGLADQLCGDVVLLPFSDGTPDWEGTTRETLEKVSHWSDIGFEDIDRLAILTDGFGRWLRDADGVSVVTWYGSGTPVVQQIDGDRRESAVELIMDALIDQEPIQSPRIAPAPPAAANDNTPPASGALTFINPADWHGQPIPSRQWYAPDLIPMRQVTILNGDGGVGKSLLALQIAAAGAMSVDTLDIEPWAGRSMYVGAEDEADEFHRRLVDIAKSHGKELDDLFMFSLLPLADRDALLATPDKSGNMKPTALWAKIVEFACEFEPRLVVLDTAADLFGGDEIKRGQVRQFIGMLRQLAIGLDCAVVLLAHPSVAGMQSGTGSSGSTAWNNSVRSRLYLTRPDDKEDPDLRILKTMKSNYGTAGGEIRLRWKDGAFVLDDGKRAAGSMLVAAKAERVFRDLLSLFNRTGQNVSDVTGTSYAPAKMAKHPDADGVSKKSLAEAMQRLLDRGEVKIVLDGPPSRQRKRLILTSEDFGPDRDAA